MIQPSSSHFSWVRVSMTLLFTAGNTIISLGAACAVNLRILDREHDVKTNLFNKKLFSPARWIVPFLHARKKNLILFQLLSWAVSPVWLQSLPVYFPKTVTTLSQQQQLLLLLLNYQTIKQNSKSINISFYSFQ
jgi:hypothetical protein